MQPGDVLAFNAMIVHGAKANNSIHGAARIRSAMSVAMPVTGHSEAAPVSFSIRQCKVETVLTAKDFRLPVAPVDPFVEH